ncbi:uncharacterized protein EI97DRAFT_410930 [Westerdykella ornata]|uniref:WW domain-containing protein n=1 Tax=Westerdykella ornata TaxID=318751 RepID=A0A6A6JUF6_WESOR|nr:uncharacterized protein EI97DRAFT_410930 [Westerdykella ornata]KAF2280017.1 hypothetical protein EI97DRAFT_410930 [Westerdykella ornata]
MSSQDQAPGNPAVPEPSPSSSRTPPAHEQDPSDAQSRHSSLSEDGETTSNAHRESTPPRNPPLPDEEAPPLPDEPAPEDDGWDALWDSNAQAYYFYNRYTQVSQWENPRVPEAAGANYGSFAPGVTSSSGAPGTSSPPKRRAGGYNPAIHGSYDPNADYAREGQDEEEEEDAAASALASGLADPTQPYVAAARFNRFTGRFQDASLNPDRHSDEQKSRRQMSAFFDVDAAANSHDGRSLKAERRGKTLSKKELKAYKEKRREKKEEKRRAWLRD